MTAVKEPRVDFELHNSSIARDDACLQWLFSRYRAHTSTTLPSRSDTSAAPTTKGNDNIKNATEALLVQLENDVTACKALRWEKFRYSSPIYEAASPTYPLRRGSTIETVVEEVEDSAATTGTVGKPHRVLRVKLQESSPKHDHEARVRSVQEEPSRHVFAEMLRKKNRENLVRSIEEAEAARGHNGHSGWLRPYFGGYFHMPLPRGPTRFLVFPQWHHDVTVATEKQQWFPYFLRGSCYQKGPHARVPIVGDAVRPLRMPWNDLVLAVSFAREFPRELSEDFGDRVRLWRDVDAIYLDGHANQVRTERLVLCKTRSKSPEMNHLSAGETAVVSMTEEAEAEGKETETEIITTKLRESGFRASLQFRNPRYSLTVKGTTCIPERAPNQRITSLLVLDEYDSFVQHFTSPFLRWLFPRATYCLRWAGGPGVDFNSAERSLTFFGKLWSEWWVELPLRADRFFLRLRNKSSLVQPLTAGQWKQTFSDVQVNGSHGNHAVRSGEHSLFWATQGPVWDAGLIRGFRDIYPGMHYASRWYTVLSMELGFGGKLRDESKMLVDGASQTGWRKPGGMIYANACLMDSFKNPPRASMGFSLTSRPRAKEDAFNTLAPSSFECSFNWWLKFGRDGMKLLSGLVEGQSVDKAVLRPSATEAFHHLRCGLTWNL